MDRLDDQEFLSQLNEISKRHGLLLPVLQRDQEPSTAFLADWARFLEMCVKGGLLLSDPRWQRVTVASNHPHTRFALEPGGMAEPDADFRVGLQLLVGILERSDEEPASGEPLD